MALAALALLAAACSPQGAEAPDADGGDRVVNVYTSRHYDSDRALYAAFTEATGIEVRVQSKGAEQLLALLQQEGDQTPADLIVTVDAGNLYRLTEAGLLQPVSTPALEAAVPAQFRDPEGRWWAFSKRARVIAYRREGFDPATADTMAELTAPSLRGQVCARSSTNIYNLSMLSAMIDRDGPEQAEAWARGVVANFARPPRGNDTDQLRDIAAGECSVAIVNHYYMLRLERSEAPEDRAVAAAVAIQFPDQDGVGTHVNVSGAGVSAYAQHRDEAIALLEFLVSAQAQSMLAEMNEEFPVSPDAPVPAALQALGAFREQDTPLAALGEHQTQAARIFEAAGWP
jgi:iron(III) transport system substrate-binding protein